MLHNYNIPVTIIRGGNRHRVMCIASSDRYSLPVDADIEEGDIVERTLPNGKLRRTRITRVDVFENPFGTSNLDHTEAYYTTQLQEPKIGATHTWNVHAANVQMATGDNSNQTMNVGFSTAELRSLIASVVELMRSLDVVDDDELEAQATEALDTLDPASHNLEGLEKFKDWMMKQVAASGSAAVVPALTVMWSEVMSQAGHWLNSAI